MFEAATGLKDKYHSGAQILGVGARPHMTREQLQAILDVDDYDFVSIDSQHAPLHEERSVDFCGMAEDLGVFVQFRIKHTRLAYMVGNYLDLGPCGVEIPLTETRDTSDEAIHHFYYPPDGGRSFGGGSRRSVGDHPDYRAYAEWWNSYGVLWLQIESPSAVLSAADLARPDVDCLSFGPTDLSANLDLHFGHELRTVDDCIVFACRSLEGSGTAVCHRNGSPDTRQKFADMGVTVFLESARA